MSITSKLAAGWAALIGGRMAAWLYVSLGLAVLILLLAPQQLPVSLYKLSLIASAAWLGYWIDRGLFPYARPDRYLVTPVSLGVPYVPGSEMIREGHHLVFVGAMARRAVILSAAMLGVALGA